MSTGVVIRDLNKPTVQVSTPRAGGTSLNEVNGCPIDFYADGAESNLDGIDLSSFGIEVTVDSDRVRIKVSSIASYSINISLSWLTSPVTSAH